MARRPLRRQGAHAETVGFLLISSANPQVAPLYADSTSRLPISKTSARCSRTTRRFGCVVRAPGFNLAIHTRSQSFLAALAFFSAVVYNSTRLMLFVGWQLTLTYWLFLFGSFFVLTKFFGGWDLLLLRIDPPSAKNA